MMRVMVSTADDPLNWSDPPPPESPTPGGPEPASPERRGGRGMHVVRWMLWSAFAALGCILLGGVALMSVYKIPFRTVLGLPYPLTQRTNVLIMGLDRTVSDQNPNIVYPVSRTDTLIAASFDPGSRRVHLLSVPRDTRASIPGHGTTKINAAHALGGAPLTLRAVQNFLGVRFPYYIEITERGYVRLIDAVGGVNIHVEKDLNYDDNWDGLHIHLQKGYRRLGGKAAIEFARFRHDPLGDIGRIRRQQEVMGALLDELRRPQIVTHLDRILKVFREDITTNLPQDRLITLALFGTRLQPGGLVRETLPGSFGSVGGDWLPNVPRDRETIARMFYDVDAETLARTSVEVVAASISRDLVTDARARLTALGIRIARIRTTSEWITPAVIVHRGTPRVAEVVAALVGGSLIMDSASQDGPDLTVHLAETDQVTPVLLFPR
jgi:LCP family protein required for cell wall assembly